MADKQKHTALDKVTHVADIVSLLAEYDKKDQVWMIRQIISLTETRWRELHMSPND